MGAWDCTVRICRVGSGRLFSSQLFSTECVVELSAPILDMQWDCRGEKIFVIIGSEKDNVVELTFERLVEKTHDKVSKSQLDVAWKTGDQKVVGTHIGGIGLAVWDNRPGKEEFREVLPPLQARTESRRDPGGTIREIGEFVLTVGINGELAIWHTIFVFKEQQSYQWSLLKRVRLTESPAYGYPTCIDIHMTSGLIVVGVGSQIRIAMIDDLLSQPTSGFSKIEYNGKENLLNCLKIRQRAADMDDLEEDYSEILVIAGRADGRCNVIYISLEDKKSIQRNNFIFRVKVQANDINLYPVSGVGFCNLSFPVFFTISAEDKMIIWNVKKKSKLLELMVPRSEDARCRRSFTAGDFSKDGNFFVGAIGYDWSRGVENISLPATSVNFLVHSFTKEQLLKRQ